MWSDHKHEHLSWTYTIYSPHHNDTSAESMYSHYVWLPVTIFTCAISEAVCWSFRAIYRWIKSQEKIQTGQDHTDASQSGDLSTATISLTVDQLHKDKWVLFLKRLGTSLTGIKDSVSDQIESLKAVAVLFYFIIITTITIIIKIFIIILVHIVLIASGLWYYLINIY